LLSQAVFSQVKERHGLIRNSKLEYSLSADDNWLMVEEITEKKERFSIFLNLNDWSVKTSPLMGESKILPDMKGATLNYIGSYQGGNNWVACKKFCSYYFSDLANKFPTQQWPDHNYLLGLMPDGTFLASDDFSMLTLPSSRTIIKGLKTIDPMSGNTVKTFQDLVVIGRHLPDYGIESKVIGNGSILMWNKDQAFITVPINTGKPVIFDTFAPISSFSGTLGLAVNCAFAYYGPNNETMYNNRQMLYEMSTGKTVWDTTFRNQKGVIYSGTSQDGSIYTLNAKSGELKKQLFKDKGIVTVSQTTLQLPDMPLYGYTQGYDLAVSSKAAKLLLIPKYWKRVGEKTNELYAWDLNTGKLVFKIKDFYYPYDAFLAEKQKEADRWKNYTPEVKKVNTIQPNTMVKSTDGYNYVLLSFNTTTKIWDVVRLQKDRKGNFERSFTTKPEGIFTLVSSTKCSLCGGGGAMAVVRDQSSSTVDNYNARLPGGKVITTTTKQVEGTATCTKCRGAGFEHGN
ncbi:MAG: hypothetical protein H7Y07_02145, partial [Pyrinomonadaceae bacterium]|nr:hypothetical protein [Sphingobacteriaceae bacterium]